MLKVEPAALTLLANQAFHDINFYLRTEHLEQVAAILADKEASDNDRAVALAMLRNAEVAAKGVLPFCQDTGTAQITAKKGQQVWTGGDDAEAAWHQLCRACPHEAMSLHIVHAAVVPRRQPSQQSGLGMRQIHRGNANLGESQLTPPKL